MPVIIHSGTSSFPGARARFGDPALLSDVIEDLPGCSSCSPTAAAAGGTTRRRSWRWRKDNVWLDLAGLPPAKLPEYYARFDFARLATRFVFGTDWPGVPGPARNVKALCALGLPDDTVRAVLSGNANRLFPDSGFRFGPAPRGRPVRGCGARVPRVLARRRPAGVRSCRGTGRRTGRSCR